MAMNVGQRHIPETEKNLKLYAWDAALELAAYTIHICSNSNVFMPEYSYITKKIVDTALDIYIKARMANDLDAREIKNYSVRNTYQSVAMAQCDSLIYLIDLSKRVYHLKDKRIKYWSMMTLDVKKQLIKWREYERKNYPQHNC